jgi:hypothetical protein
MGVEKKLFGDGIIERILLDAFNSLMWYVKD